MIFGFALNSEVTNLRLGIVDESRTLESRAVVSAFVESRSFHIAASFASAAGLGAALSAGKLDAGLIVPSDFAERRQRRETARVQLLLDAVNSNTAGIAGGYAARIIGALNERLAPAVALDTSGGAVSMRGRFAARVALFFNPGLESAWFIVTGVIGALLVLNGSIIGGAALVKEKEAGTIEQLLMTPAQAAEIVTAKIAPLFVLLSLQIVLALAVSWLVFGLPLRGNLVLLFTAGMLCVLVGIGIGTFLATFSRSQQQAQLMSFFINPPLSLLSGALSPVEAMPAWLQPFTLLNPICHFVALSQTTGLRCFSKVDGKGRETCQREGNQQAAPEKRLRQVAGENLCKRGLVADLAGRRTATGCVARRPALCRHLAARRACDTFLSESIFRFEVYRYADCRPSFVFVSRSLGRRNADRRLPAGSVLARAPGGKIPRALPRTPPVPVSLFHARDRRAAAAQSGGGNFGNDVGSFVRWDGSGVYGKTVGQFDCFSHPNRTATGKPIWLNAGTQPCYGNLVCSKFVF